MDSAQGFNAKNDKDGDRTKLSAKKSSTKQQNQEKVALTPIEEETDTPDSSGDNAENYCDIENEASRLYPYDSYRSDSMVACNEFDEETTREDEEPDRSSPFLTARNNSDRLIEYYNCESNSSAATTSNERNTEDDDDEELETRDEDSSLADGSTSGDVEDFSCPEDCEVNEPDLRVTRNDDLARVANERATRGSDNLLLSSRKKFKTNRRPKSAPTSRSMTRRGETSTRPDDKFIRELAATLDSLKTRIAKTERDIFDLKKELRGERIKGRKLARIYEEDRKVARESLRIDLELWIKKLNDSLKGYLGDWQKRERLRINEEISRISDLYSQEIARRLKIALKEWQAEDAKNIRELIARREKARTAEEETRARDCYDRIRGHLENLERRNRKSYESLCKQIDKWEDRLRHEIVKLHEDDIKKLRHQVDSWCEDGSRKEIDPGSNCERKRNDTWQGTEALLRIEENLLKRLRESSSKDLRRTEQLLRTELRIQRREFAKRMNDRIGELWRALEEFGDSNCSRFHDRSGPRVRNDLDVHRAGSMIGSSSKDSAGRPDVAAGRVKIGGKIVRSRLHDDSCNGDFDGDRDRDCGEDDNDKDDDNDDDDDGGNGTPAASFERSNKTIFPPISPESNFTSDKNCFANRSKDCPEI